MGLAKGIIADAEVNEQEVVAIASWVLSNQEVAELWPINILVDRIDKILQDGIIDPIERADLKKLLAEMVGGDGFEQHLAATSTRLPLTQPPPQIVFPVQTFVFTGKFVYGIRRDCQRAVEERGGFCLPGVTKQTNYVVIGLLGSADWICTNFGRKIEKAVEYSEKFGLQIVGEDHWASCLAGQTIVARY